MEKTTAFALAFLFFVLGGLFIVFGQVKENKKVEAQEKIDSAQKVDALADAMVNLNAKQSRTDDKIVALEQRKVLSEDEVLTAIDVISTAKAQEIVDKALKAQYYPTAYCLESPNANGGIDLSCRDVTG